MVNRHLLHANELQQQALKMIQRRGGHWRGPVAQHV